MKTIVVTGASSGIGHAIVRELLEHDYFVFGSVRRSQDADRLQQEFGHHFTPLIFDVTNHDSLLQAVQQVTDQVGDRGLVGLVNNAGIATCGPLMHQTLDEVRAQFEVNVIGSLAVNQAFLPLLGATRPCPHPPGRLIMMSSLTGKISPPFLGAYVGSKHAIEGMSQTLRRELLPYGVDVIVVAPGMINTPIWDKESAHDATPYLQTGYGEAMQRYQAHLVRSGKRGCRAGMVARCVRRALEARHPKTRYTIVPNLLVDWYYPRILPDRWFDWLISPRIFLSPRSYLAPIHYDD